MYGIPFSIKSWNSKATSLSVVRLNKVVLIFFILFSLRVHLNFCRRAFPRRSKEKARSVSGQTLHRTSDRHSLSCLTSPDFALMCSGASTSTVFSGGRCLCSDVPEQSPISLKICISCYLGICWKHRHGHYCLSRSKPTNLRTLYPFSTSNLELLAIDASGAV